jgi:hypothetical protein
MLEEQAPTNEDVINAILDLKVGTLLRCLVIIPPLLRRQNITHPIIIAGIRHGHSQELVLQGEQGEHFWHNYNQELVL